MRFNFLDMAWTRLRCGALWRVGSLSGVAFLVWLRRPVWFRSCARWLGIGWFNITETVLDKSKKTNFFFFFEPDAFLTIQYCRN